MEDYFGRHSRKEEPGEQVRGNALELLSKVNALLSDIPLPEAETPVVRSGWRPLEYNSTVPGAAPNSKHIIGQAIDLADPDGALDDFLFRNPHRLVEHGLYMEHPGASKGWTHLQCVAPRSGNRIFWP